MDEKLVQSYNVSFSPFSYEVIFSYSTVLLLTHMYLSYEIYIYV